MERSIERVFVGLAVAVIVIGEARQREALGSGKMYWTDLGINKIQRVNLNGTGVEVYRGAARRLGIELVEQTVHAEEEAQATLAQVQKGHVDGILAPDALSFNIPGFVLEAASLQAMPTTARSRG